jgi:hypothetical protein
MQTPLHRNVPTFINYKEHQIHSQGVEILLQHNRRPKKIVAAATERVGANIAMAVMVEDIPLKIALRQMEVRNKSHLPVRVVVVREKVIVGVAMEVEKVNIEKIFKTQHCHEVQNRKRRNAFRAQQVELQAKDQQQPGPPKY